MTLFFYYGSGDLGNEAVRLGTGFSFTEAADSGMLSMSRVRIDDPTGSLDFVGHHNFHVRETAGSYPWLFRGYFGERQLSRADSLLTGAARVWDCTVYDLNAALQFEVIRGTTGQRPAETDTERLAWILGSAFKGPISSDDTFVFGAGDNMDKTDYRGQTMADVLSDCAQTSGNNYFVTWSEDVGAPVLHYYLPTRATYSSTLKISNVLSDVDMSTVYAPDKEATLNLDPSNVFSGIYYQYGEKGNAVTYQTNATVLAAIGHKRETSTDDGATNTATKAANKANKWLSEAEDELKTVSVTLQKVAPSDVNLIRVGHRIQVKFTHLPGFTSYTWVRVVRRSVEQDGDTQAFYRMRLELANPKQGGGKNRHKPKPPEDAETGPGDGVFTVATRQSVHNTLKEDDWYGLFTAGAPYVGSWVSQNTAYTTSGCPLGGGLWGPGGITWEAWFGVTVTGASEDIGCKAVIGALGTLLGILTTGAQLLVGWANAAPSNLGDFVPVGVIDPAGGTVYVPGNLVDSGGTNYLVIAPNWRATANWAICGNYITDGYGGPLVGGEANSGRGIAMLTSEITITALKNAGVGMTGWTAPIGSGTADGSNTVWTLSDWSGEGIPQARWGAIILGAADYEYDQQALTVTFHEPPPAGTRVAFRYRLSGA